MALTTVKNAGLAGSIDLATKVTGILPTSNYVDNGKIIQISSTKATSTANLATTSFATVCSHSITPSSTSSNVIVFMSGGRWSMYDADSYEANYQLTKTGGTVLMQGLQATRNTGGNTTAGTISISYLDSPSTTSAVTYFLQAKTTNASKAVNIQDTNHPISIVLMEVSA